MSPIEINGKKHLLLSKLIRKLHREEPTLSEEEFRKVLRSFDKEKCLEELAQLSLDIYNDNLSTEYYTRIAKSTYRHNETGVFLTQFALEYIATLLLTSGTNYNNHLFKNEDILGLLNIYSNSLIQPLPKNIHAILIPMYIQQFPVQGDDIAFFSRQIYLFEKIASKVKLVDDLSFNDFFKQETGLSLSEYSNISYIFFAFLYQRRKIKIKDIDTRDEDFKKILSSEKISNFLNLHSSDVEGMQKLDISMNLSLDPKYTKSRLSPLSQFPLLKTEDDVYLCPSFTLFVEATFKSLFWWFDNHFKKSEKYENNVFRDVFGFRVFEPYVGDILERNYGKNNVYPSIKYGKPTTDFVDWYVLSNNKVYLYEVKAYQFPLYLLQAINEEKLKIELERKIIKPMIQVYKRIKDIDKYEELKHLRGKKLIPVIIFYNIPLINTSMYNSEIKILLSEIEDRYQGISELEFVLLNIDDLELFEIVSKHTNIEEIYKNAISNQGNFQSQLSDFCEEKNIPENRNSLTEDFYSKKVEYIEKMMSIS